jgi:hypothetical protein
MIKSRDIDVIGIPQNTSVVDPYQSALKSSGYMYIHKRAQILRGSKAI